jgi:hypothetical protein
MDDQQGNVIDGTARARQWRLVRSKTRSASDGAEVRSDAPKSIAGSLLVPAGMLSIGGTDDDGAADSGVTEVAAASEVALEDAPPIVGSHQNPFLVAEEPTSEGTKTPARTRISPIHRLLPRRGARRMRLPDRQAHARFARPPTRERKRRLRRAAGIIAGVAVLGVAASVVIESGGGTGHAVAKPRQPRLVVTASGQGAAQNAAARLKVAAVLRRERQATQRAGARHPATRQRRSRHPTQRLPSSSPSHWAAPRSRGPSPLAVQATAAATGSAQRSSAATAETVRAVTTTPASVGTTSAPPPPGPSGPGGTVGSNCNPKCS